ncbi:putative membrane-associated guanylate kinase, partial [Triplophysa rosa]
LLPKDGPTHHRSPAIHQTFTNHHDTTTRGRGSRATRSSTATGRTTATPTTDTDRQRRGAGTKVTEGTADLRSLRRGRRGLVRITRTIITIEAIITTANIAHRRSAELGAPITPWTADTGARLKDAIIVNLPPAGTVHLNVPPTDPVTGAARLSGVDHPTILLTVPGTSLPQGGPQLIRINPTTSISTLRELPAIDRLNLEDTLPREPQNYLEQLSPMEQAYRESSLLRGPSRDDTLPRVRTPDFESAFRNYNSLLRGRSPVRGEGRQGGYPRAESPVASSYRTRSLGRDLSPVRGFRDEDEEEDARSQLSEYYSTLRSNYSRANNNVPEPRRKPYKDSPKDLSI